MTGDWMDFGLVTDVLDVLERHGYARGGTEHATRAILLISDLGRIYDGTLDYPSGLSLSPAAPPQAEPAPPGPAGRNTVAVPASDITTVLAALDEAAEYKRDLATACPDWARQSCGTCQWRLQAAQAYDALAAQLTTLAEASRSADARHAGPGANPRDGLRAGPGRRDPEPGLQAEP